MSERDHQTLGFYERRGDLELGRGNVISTGDLATFPGSYPVYSSSAVGEGVFGRYGQHMFDEELITWSIDGGGRPFHRRKHRFSVTNVCGFLRVKRPDRWDYGYLHAVLEGLQSGIQFDYQMKAHPSVIRELYRFDCIPIEEQRRISSIRDTLDTTIRQTEAIIAKLKQVKQGLLHVLLTRGIDANGELRPPQSEAPHLYMESALGWVPKDWKVEPLRALAVGGLMNGVFKEPKRVGRGVALVNVADLYRGQSVNLNQCERFAATGPEIERYGVAEGDIFFTRSSLKLDGIAQTSIVDDEPNNAVFECHVMRLRPNRAVSVPRFLKEWCVSRQAREHFMRHAKQVTMTTISQDGINSLLCIVPPIAEQVAAVSRITALDDRISEELRNLSKTRLIKAGLMDDLLTGRVRVTALLTQPTAT